MAIFYADVEKRLGSEFWSNRYILQAASLAEAITRTNSIVEVEREWHTTPVTFTRHRVSTAAVDDGVYTITPINLAGQRGGSTALLPLFNTLRVDFSASVGRPSRKFYRGILAEGDIAGDGLTTNFNALAASLETRFATAEAPGIIDPQGSLLQDATIHPFVQMRQLRRSRRRRDNGGGIFQ